jgi:hypothetical protein
MVDAGEVEECFGAPRGYSGVDAWGELEAASGRPLPADYKGFVAAYGPGIVGAFLRVLHPRSAAFGMVAWIETLGPVHQRLVPHAIPHPVFPAKGGMVLWALTADLDACFLVPGTRGSWRIGVWLRQRARWQEFEDGVPAWLVRQVRGTLVVDGLPLGEYGTFVPVD